jgi:ATP-dependent Clp protease ATP-binding subunit ClpA
VTTQEILDKARALAEEHKSKHVDARHILLVIARQSDCEERRHLGDLVYAHDRALITDFAYALKHSIRNVENDWGNSELDRIDELALKLAHGELAPKIAVRHVLVASLCMRSVLYALTSLEVAPSRSRKAA